MARLVFTVKTMLTDHERGYIEFSWAIYFAGVFLVPSFSSKRFAGSGTGNWRRRGNSGGIAASGSRDG
jgi:hypothetical protein